MKLLANENFPLSSAEALRVQGHDIISMSKHAPGMSDIEVLSLAHREDRIILTFDRDYGMLVYSLHLPSPPSIIYLRFRPKTPFEPAERLQPLLNMGENHLRGFFIVVERDVCRRRPLPPSISSTSNPV